MAVTLRLSFPPAGKTAWRVTRWPPWLGGPQLGGGLTIWPAAAIARADLYFGQLQPAPTAALTSAVDPAVQISGGGGAGFMLINGADRLLINAQGGRLVL